LTLDGANYKNYVGNFASNGKQNGDGVYEAFLKYTIGHSITHFKIRGEWSAGVLNAETCWEYWTVVIDKSTSTKKWVKDNCENFFSEAQITKLDIHDLHVPRASRIVGQKEKQLEKLFSNYGQLWCTQTTVSSSNCTSE